MNFYEKFLQLCIENGKKPSAVAEEINLTRQAVCKWKSGSVPSDDTLMRMAKYFGISFSEFRELAK